MDNKLNWIMHIKTLANKLSSDNYDIRIMLQRSKHLL